MARYEVRHDATCRFITRTGSIATATSNSIAENPRRHPQSAGGPGKGGQVGDPHLTDQRRLRDLALARPGSRHIDVRGRVCCEARQVLSLIARQAARLGR